MLENTILPIVVLLVLLGGVAVDVSEERISFF
jgi:hypothetical protein